MAPLGTAESTTGNINEDLQHYKKKLDESMPRALFPWLWPVPISNRRGFEMGETSPSPLSPLRGLYRSALIAACRQQRWLWLTCCPHASLVSVLTQMVQTPAAGTNTGSVTHLFCQLAAAMFTPKATTTFSRDKNEPSVGTGAQECKQQEIWGRKGGLGDFRLL